MAPTHSPSQAPKPRMNSSGIWPATAINATAASMPTSVPMMRQAPLPMTAPCTGLITSSTVEAAENGISSSSR